MPDSSSPDARSVYAVNLEEIFGLPLLFDEIVDSIEQAIRSVLVHNRLESIEQIHLVGCGDSHHAGLCAQMAIARRTSLPVSTFTAMDYARYRIDTFKTNIDRILTIAISASGRVSRTIEAIERARVAGAITVALTGKPDSPLAKSASILIPCPVKDTGNPRRNLVLPGSRTFFASLIGLNLLGNGLALVKGLVNPEAYTNSILALKRLNNITADSLAIFQKQARELVQLWFEMDNYVFCGAGPNYGTALFCAAKVLESSGDEAMGQDLEEWAHLQYFARKVRTPTFIITAGARDYSRAIEVLEAAAAIGRRIALVAPESFPVARYDNIDGAFFFRSDLEEDLTPFVTILPGMIFAAHRAEALDEPFFRGFGGGRSVSGGGGISRIQNSERITKL